MFFRAIQWHMIFEKLEKKSEENNRLSEKMCIFVVQRYTNSNNLLWMQK